MEKKRGALLTICAIGLGLMALSDFSKPLHPGGAHTTFIFLGMRTSGIATVILGPLFGIMLAALSAGILMMKRYAMGLAHAYTFYVILNILLFHLREKQPGGPG